VRGRIYFHNQFGFHDGGVGKKFLILINNPKNTEPYLFVKTTSHQKDKPNKYGCHFTRKVFFIPSGKTYFPLDTWIQFHEIYAFAYDRCIKLGIDKILHYKDKFSEQVANEIVNCLLRSSIDDIEPAYLKLIKKR
jgi:hypothetical protein